VRNFRPAWHRGTAPLAVALAVCACVPAAKADAADRPKQVLILNSTRQDDQFSVVLDRDVPKLLAKGLNERVDFYSEYLDFLRFPQPANQNLYVNFLRQKYVGRHLDLLIIVGDVAIEFMNSRRDVLFAGTPVVTYSVTPPRIRLANSTGLNNPLHFHRSIDLALTLQPDLEHVYVVSGAGESDKRYEQLARAEFRAFEGRVAFTYLSGLVTRDLETRLRNLPRRSAVYYVIVSKDGAGEYFQQMSYLSRVAAAANAPTYSWADAAADSGILGGSRRDQPAQVRAIVALALRVLRGERPDDIAVSSLNTDVEQVDWRQLRRWGLDASRLPASVRVLSRIPGLWDQYSRYVIGTAGLMLAQMALIATLLLQRRKRRRVERALRGSQARLRLSYNQIRDLSRRLLGEQEAERARIARELHDDINQQLTLLSIDLDRIRSGQLQADTAKRLSGALQTTHDVAASVRELSHRLHPSRLQLIGLVAGLDSLRRDLSPPQLPIAFCHRDVPPAIDPEIALCLFRVAQEALANAVKHSEAHLVSVELAGEPSGLRLTVTDDGKGFDVNGLDMGLGLISMRERVESVGGVLVIDAAPASGTLLQVTVPTHMALAAVTSA